MNKPKKVPKNVFVIKRNGKPYRYMARITVQRLKLYVGCFLTEAEAIEAAFKAKEREFKKLIETRS